MKPSPPIRRLALCAALLGASAAASAMHVANEPVASAGGTTPGRWAHLPSATVTLVDGSIGAVDRAHHTVTIAGQTLALHPSRLVIYRGNARVGASALAPGQKVRFAVEPGSPTKPRRIVAIYLQSAP